jgi:uncharacterized protein (TIGR02099 family)
MLSPSTPDRPELPPARNGAPWRVVSRSARFLATLVLIAFSLAVIAWLTLQWGILPRIDEWRPQIEMRASSALGQPVRIGSIQVQSSGWVPALDLRDVRLLDGEGRTALALGRVRVALSPRSLLAMQPRLAQLHLQDVSLDIRRDVQGRIRIAGLDLAQSANQGDDGAAADWLFSQGEIVVQHGTVRWTDERRAAPTLELSDVQVVLRNGLREHDARIDATPPAQWGDRFSLRGRFTQPLLARSGDWRRWKGTLFAELPRADVSELRRHVDLPFDLNEGRGALRAWLELQAGHWREMTADVALADVSVRMAKTLEPLALGGLSTRVQARRDAAGVALQADRLAFTTADGLVWPAGDLSLAWQQVQALEPGAPPPAADVPQAPVTGGQLRAGRLDLAQMSIIATRLPLGAAMQSSVAALAPSGVASDLSVQWQGAIDAPRTYRAQGRVAGLSLAPLASATPGHIGRPGLSGAEIEFDANESGGQARLSMKGGRLHFPGVFEQSTIALDKLAARLDWRVTRLHAAAGAAGVASAASASAATALPSIELDVSDATFANADAQGDLRGKWKTGKPSAHDRGGFGTGAWLPGEIDMTGHFVRARGSRVSAYLPLGIPQQARDYVTRAVREGEVESATFAVKGDVWQFPYHRTPGGVFRITAKVRDGVFDYLPSTPAGPDTPAWVSPWPALSNLQGELVIDRNALQLNGVQARLWGTQLRQFNARIDNLADHPVLTIQGEGRGPVADILKYVDTTPIGGWLRGALKPITAAGAGDLKLALSIPITDAAKTTVDGSVTLGGNDVHIRAGTPLLAGTRGRIEFTQRSFAIKGASAKAVGGEVRFEGGMPAGAAMKFNAKGTASAEGLRAAAELGLLPLVATHLGGQTSYQLALGIADGAIDVNVTSDLVGLSSTWPAPLSKAAATAWPTRWHMAPAHASVPPGKQSAQGSQAKLGSALETLRLDVGETLQLRLTRDVSGESPRILSGALGVREAAPADGAAHDGVVHARVALGAVDADAWWRAWQRAAAQGGGGDGLPALQIDAHADQLMLADRRFGDSTLAVQFDPRAAEAPWRLQWRSARAGGQASWRPPAGVADPGRLVARLDHLNLPQIEVFVSAPGESAADASVEPATQMPALDIVVNDFAHGGRKLGKLEVQAVSKTGGARAGATEWRLDKLALTMPEAQFQASGTWASAASPRNARRMTMNFTLDTADSGQLATRFGLKDALRGGKGRLRGALAWDGTPLSPDIASMQGQLHVALESGQFMRAEPGVGRVLGILSLQSLPRRLLLDFRDVFQDGFSFDSVEGDITLARGEARTDNLLMQGVQASVLMAGSADLLRESQDLRVTVVPEINAGAASLAYAAINPVVGLGTFLAQWILRDPLREAGTREFHITGPIAEPKVEQVARAASGVPAVSDSTAKETPP